MNWLSNLKLGTQMLIVFGLLAGVSVVNGLIGISNSSELSDQLSHMHAQNITSLRDLNSLSTSFQGMRGDLMLMLLSPTQDQARSFAVKAGERYAEMQSVARSLADVVNKDQKPVIEEFSSIGSAFDGYIRTFESLASAGRLEEARTLLLGSIDSTRYEMQVRIESLSQMINTNAEADAVAGESLSRSTLYLTFGSTGLGILMVVLLGWFVTRSITGPIAGLVRTIDTADLNTTFDTGRKDEVGDLMRSVDRFVATVRDTLLKVVEATAAVASATSEISASTEQMAAGAQQQSAQASDVSAAVEEVTKTIFANAKNANTTAETAASAKNAANEGGSVVAETIAYMRQIAATVKRGAEIVRALGESSNQIGKIILVIDDVADQTNLLALNAAIEAARAGEQGRGFAVVADEVRKLAERTTKATKEIAEMIEKIQGDTALAVRSMEQGSTEVDQGIRLADAAGTSLRDIVGISQKVTDMIAQIAAASEQQSGASEEISKSVEGISTVTQETATGIQQIARTSEDLNRLTSNLEQLVARFKIKGTAESTPEHASAAPARKTAGPAVRKDRPVVHDRRPAPAARVDRAEA